MANTLGLEVKLLAGVRVRKASDMNKRVSLEAFEMQAEGLLQVSVPDRVVLTPDEAITFAHQLIDLASRLNEKQSIEPVDDTGEHIDPALRT